MAKLNPRHKRFCEEYLVDLNGTQAYLRAGYKVGTPAAATAAYELLRKPEIQEYIQKLKNDRSDRTAISSDRVLKELSRIAFSDVAEAVEVGVDGLQLKEITKLDRDTTAAISEIGEFRSEKGNKFSLKMHNKLGALTLLMQHLGMSNDFNQCLAGLRKYGLELWQDESGKWQVSDAHTQADNDESQRD